jgi:energy-coupling factor transporter ATP-binding protein EcfA2
VTALALAHVTYRYPGAPAPALDDVSVEVEPGEFVVVAGPSAGGKSTLLRAACGLVPHFFGGEIAGQVTVAGLDVRDHGPGELARRVGTLFQDPETQVVMGVVRAELAFPLENRGEPPGAVARAVEEVALALGVAHLLDRSTAELSGGELQRVALGAALAGRPALVALDEPTAQLDPVAGDELIGLLRRLNEEHGTAILLAEHRLERCLAAADRVLVLSGGRLACDAPPAEFLAWAARSAPALQTPGARLLARAGIAPPPVGVKGARAALRAHGLLPPAPDGPAAAPAPRRRRSGRRGDWGLRLERVWRELPGGRAVLRGIDLALAPGELVALMGRNGAGKSTLLRVAAGLDRPSRGRVRAAGRVGLLLQDPNPYLVHETVGAEAPGAPGLEHLAVRHPRDLSGGERQRVALAVVAGGDDRPSALLLDEPTRGMDREAKMLLLDDLRRQAAAGAAAIVATHDAELAAALGGRVILLGDGVVVADGPAPEVLSGGWYFTTETARILGGAGGALLPADGAELLSTPDPLTTT